MLSWPPEIWLRVLFAAKPAVMTTEGFSRFPNSSSSQTRDLLAYKHYLQLKSVCSKFRTMFATYPELMTDLVFCPPASTQEAIWLRYARLTQWLKANPQITSMCVYFPVDIAKRREARYSDNWFWALDQIRLKSISIAAPISFMTIPQAFATVTICHIRTPFIGGFRQLPVNHILRRMCNLQSLTLQDGYYCTLTLPASLTTLRIIDGNLSEGSDEMGNKERPSDWSQAHKLQELILCRGEISDMHELGLCACTNLQKLELQFSRFTAAAKVNSFVYGKGFPQAMSTVSTLTSLSVSLPKQSTFCQDVQCMSSLCRLNLICQGTELSAAMESLTNLTELRIQALSHLDDKHGVQVIPTIKVAFDWGELRALQSIVVSGPAILGTTFTSVISLPQLRYLGLHQFWSGDLATEQAVDDIKALAKTHAPEVLIEVALQGTLDAACFDKPPHEVQKYLDLYKGAHEGLFDDEYNVNNDDYGLFDDDDEYNVNNDDYAHAFDDWID